MSSRCSTIYFGDTVRVVGGRKRVGHTGKVSWLSSGRERQVEVSVYLGDWEWGEFPIENLELVQKCAPLNTGVLERLSASFYEEVIRRRPLWIPHAFNYVCDEQYVEFILPAPFAGSGHLWFGIRSIQGVEVEFHPVHVDLEYIGGGPDKNMGEQCEILLRYLEAIFREDLVAVKTRGFFGGADTMDLFDLFQQLSESRIVKAVSWDGNFNFVKGSVRSPSVPPHLIEYVKERPPVVNCMRCKWIITLDEAQFKACKYTCPKCSHIGKIILSREK